MEGKLQIILFIGFLEWFSELRNDDFNPHYTKGGKPGKYPPFKGNLPHPVPFNLYDPFGLAENLEEETKAQKLLSELNNGRLAMLGITGFLTEQKIPGSVPLCLDDLQGHTPEQFCPMGQV